MPTIRSTGADIHYEVVGQGSPVLLIAGLGGVGAAWGPQVALFAERHTVIVPDHRGTGKSTHTDSGLTIAQHAADFAAIVEHLGVGPVHCVGLSTGGAVTQALALEYSRLVRTATLVSTWARADPFLMRQFKVRQQVLTAVGVRACNEMAALFLFDPLFQANHDGLVHAWVDAATAGASAPEITVARINMILAHDLLDRLDGIRCPTLVVVGESDFCIPPHLSEQMAERIPGAELVKLPGGHFSYLEHPAAFHDRVESFIAQHEGAVGP